MLFPLALFASIASSALALVHGVDSSTLVSETAYAKAMSEGFTKAIIRGYEEACSVGGRVDTNFVNSYNNARAAGFTSIDTYWSPCTGSGNRCKSFAAQISELAASMQGNSMQIGTIWVDIEKDVICNSWNYGSAGNLAVARSIIETMRASGYRFGIYSSPGEWGVIFGSPSVVLANDLPLWFAVYNNDQSLTLRTPFGGWTSAVGHQYSTESILGPFNLNVFAY